MPTLEFGEGRLDFAGPAAHGSWNPVERAQPIEHGATDAWHGERLELHTARLVESLDRIDETKDACTDQIAGIDAVGQTGSDTTGNELDEWGVVHDQVVAGDRIA